MILQACLTYNLRSDNERSVTESCHRWNTQTAAIAPKAERAAGAPPLWASLALALAATCITIGIMWDISWHQTIGRDTAFGRPRT